MKPIRTKQKNPKPPHGNRSRVLTTADKAAVLRRAIRTVAEQQVDGTLLNNISASDLRALKRIHRAATRYAAVWASASPKERKALSKLIKPEMERLQVCHRRLSSLY